eukprot:5351828-Pyramimonas_sp.AAC.1
MFPWRSPAERLVSAACLRPRHKYKCNVAWVCNDSQGHTGEPRYFGGKPTLIPTGRSWLTRPTSPLGVGGLESFLPQLPSPPSGRG